MFRACTALLFALVCVLPLPVPATSSNLTGPYFGQPLPGHRAEIFAPDMLSVVGRYEFALSFAPDGRRFLLTVQEGEDVFLIESHVAAGRWTEPTRVNLTGGARQDEMEAFFTPDGTRVFFAPYDKGLDVRIWAAPVTAGGFGEAAPLTGPLAAEPAFFPTCTATGDIYFANLAQRAVYRAWADETGAWQVAAAGLDGARHPFITPDGKTVLLDGDGEGSLGEGDIWAAFATAGGGWTDPVNLGPAVNSSYGESCPTLSADGRFLFFSRYDEQDEVSQIYWVDGMVVAEKRAEVLGDESLIIQRVVTDSIAWALTKDRARLESIIAHDESYFSFHPDGLAGTRGYSQFEQGFDLWMDDRFVATTTAVRDFRCDFSRAGDVAWFSAILDDCYEWDGRPGCWQDTRWTGVLEKRAGQWVIVQMHFSFAAKG